MEVKLILAFLFVSFLSVNCFDLIERRNGAINASYLEEVIDAQECDRQVKVIRENALLLLQCKWKYNVIFNYFLKCTKYLISYDRIYFYF